MFLVGDGIWVVSPVQSTLNVKITAIDVQALGGAEVIFVSPLEPQ